MSIDMSDTNSTSDTVQEEKYSQPELSDPTFLQELKCPMGFGENDNRVAGQDVELLQQQEQLRDRIANYTYKCEYISPLYYRVISPLAEKVATLVPQNISANHITLLGGVLGVLSLVLRPFSAMLSGICFLLYNIADSVDGKVAKLRGTSSPTGEMLDHGVDVFMTGMFWIHFYYMGVTNIFMLSLYALTLYFTSYKSMIKILNTGVFGCDFLEEVIYSSCFLIIFDFQLPSLPMQALIWLVLTSYQCMDLIGCRFRPQTFSPQAVEALYGGVKQWTPFFIQIGNVLLGSLIMSLIASDSNTAAVSWLVVVGLEHTLSALFVIEARLIGGDKYTTFCAFSGVILAFFYGSLAYYLAFLLLLAQRSLTCYAYLVSAFQLFTRYAPVKEHQK
jgi:phosphatidylglycerophosphate synthase